MSSSVHDILTPSMIALPRLSRGPFCVQGMEVAEPGLAAKARTIGKFVPASARVPLMT